MQSTVIFIDWKCIETPIKLTIFLKEKVKIEGLIPNRSTGEKCSLYLSSGRPVVPLWEIREDLGRLPAQLKAHLRSTYICLAIQLGFCCWFFHAHMILVPLCNVHPSLHASLTRRRQVSHNTEASKSVSSHTWSDVHYSYGKAKWTLICQNVPPELHML